MNTQSDGGEMFEGLQDAFRAVVGGETELEAINRRLAALYDRREDLRTTMGTNAAIASGSGPEAKAGEKAARAAQNAMAALDEEIADLRARRRELNEVVDESTPLHQVLVSVPLPAELVDVQERLDRARAERRDLMAALTRAEADEETSEARNIRRQMREVEAAVVALRGEREVHLRPYNLAVAYALQPMVREAAETLAQACEGIRKSRSVLDDVLQGMPRSDSPLASAMLTVAWPDAASVARADVFARNLLAACDELGGAGL